MAGQISLKEYKYEEQDGWPYLINTRDQGKVKEERTSEKEMDGISKMIQVKNNKYIEHTLTQAYITTF